MDKKLSNYLFLAAADAPFRNFAYGGGTGKGGGTPAFLYDFVLRLFGSYSPLDEYVKKHPGKICFQDLIVPVPHRAGTWDAMYGTLKGRFGTDGYYDGFWIGIREVMNRVYGLPFGGGEYRGGRWDANVDSGRKIKVVWPWRGGGRSRDDGNRDKLQKVFGARFDFHILDGPDFAWKGPDEEARKQVAVSTIRKIQEADVMVGLFGANLWNR